AGDVGNEGYIAHQLGAVAVGVLAEDLDRTLIGGEPEHGVERRGLARAIVADEPIDAPGRDVEVEAVQDLVLAEILLEVASRYDCVAHSLSSLRSVSRERPRAVIC